MRVLLLGGTADGRELAVALRAAGHEVTESLAGRTAVARLGGPGARVGGFGGVPGLAEYLEEFGVDAVVDATHPFAAQISSNAAAACAITGTRLVRFVRASWQNHPHAAEWTWVPDHATAVTSAAGHGSGRVLLSVGRQPLPAYLGLPNVVARVAEWPGGQVPAGWRIIEARGPFTLAGELGLIRREGIALLVCKDSGGHHTDAKLDAAHLLGTPVIMIGRPAPPGGAERADSAAAVVAWLNNATDLPG